MSDDEYYGEYDDFEEGMWDADPAPDLADDLAEHAAYSPVWQDDPVGELEAYHSDWEYYSDDYYDDDPILKNTTLDGTSPAQILKTDSKTGKRGKKRKLHEARDSPRTIKKGSLLDCVRGTVWAQKQDEKHVTLRLGQQESIALLKNWKEMFKSDTGTSHTFGRGQLKRDESWANDLSLADMGLSNEKEKPGVRDTAQLDEEQENLDEEEEDPDHEDLEIAEDSGQLLVKSKFDGVGTTRSGGDLSYESDLGDVIDEDLLPQKRRKIGGLPSPPRSHESSSAVVPLEQSAKVTGATMNEMRGPHRIQSTNSDTHRATEEGGTTGLKHKSASQSKKRKLTPAAEDSEASDEPSNERPAKRSTSARVAKGHKTMKDDDPGVVRVTRSRLK